MPRTLLGRFALSVGSLVLAIPAAAHHSAAVAYDVGKTVTVKGVISEVKWENPHTWIFVEAKDESGKDQSGKVVKWGFEGKVPNQLIRTGITPARDASQNFCEVIEVTFADGKTIKP